MKCGGDRTARVELCIGALRYVTAGERDTLLAGGRFQEREPEGRVTVIREQQPAGWVPPEPDFTPAWVYEDGFREDWDGYKKELKREGVLDCTCGQEEEWCRACRQWLGLDTRQSHRERLERELDAAHHQPADEEVELS